MPTPTVGDSRNTRNITQNDGQGSRNGRPGTTLSDVAWLHANRPVMWGTPRASEWKVAGKGVTATAVKWAGQKYLTGQAQVATGREGEMLNPDFVEAMMGFPPGWTVLED